MFAYNYTAKVVNDTNYNLFYWDKEWIFVDEQRAENDTLIFQNAPKNALYKLENINDTKSFRHRCFTVDNKNNQFWW